MRFLPLLKRGKPGRPRTSSVLAASVLGSLLLLGLNPTTAHGEVAPEYQVKAAFLYNFSKFVQWPDDADGQTDNIIYLCVIGENPFGEALDGIRGKTVGEKVIDIRVLDDLDDPLDRCHILFIKTGKISTGRILERVGDRPILTVGDDENFTKAGGNIELFKAGKKVRFTVNTAAAQRADLKISSHLLKLSVPEEERSR